MCIRDRRHRAHGRGCLGTVERADEGPALSPKLESELMAKRILVVDDEPDIRRLVAEALDVTGYDVQTAANGEEAIRAASLYIPNLCLLYTSPSPRDRTRSRMPS